MNISELEKWLDDFLAKEDNLENRGTDINWTKTAEQIENELTEKSNSINKETITRILAKNISAFNKLLIRDAVRNNLNLEQIAKQRVEDCYCWYLLPQSVRSERARDAAKSLHIETHKLREEIIAHWKKHIYPVYPKLSNEKIGEWLKDSFPKLSVRKLSEYIAKAKREMKKLPPASKT